jgi:hypothetical protein
MDTSDCTYPLRPVFIDRRKKLYVRSLAIEGTYEFTYGLRTPSGTHVRSTETKRSTARTFSQQHESVTLVEKCLLSAQKS